ncbi:MAG: TlpA family protein disulfide reductase [Sphingobacteriales bacterium]|nr:MAG: TlpA family protein disulfide reductase [Sphingobacteriales bacterium]
MRYFLICFFIVINVAGFSQSHEPSTVQLNADYASIQNKLYNIANSNGDYANKQTAAYNSLSGFIKKYPKEKNCLYLLTDAVNLTMPQFDSLLNLLDSSSRQSEYWSSVQATKRRIAVAETGKLFPDIDLADTSGIITSTKSFRGKIILIDFWSSWCGPCRQQIPSLIKIYKKYRQKGFEIIGISMDNNKQAWLEAIQKDKQQWIQFCDLVKFSENKTARYFSIYGIPANFLINEEGIIVGQDISPDQVAGYLAKRF